ncbi:hypothetical protein GCM10023310_56320 [Paenibacillus vulneris]|uniref:Group-specific protein n=1 Tax=Paenibacillus vulneris TaxID=1133364 RepID=A0ABW3UV22_9BACL|nr:MULTISPECIES: hypothetical protein [unclassified Paenibacillus]MBE1446262.1 hypothetical protein [Paenibacillus sp. OAS669]
MTSIRQDWIKVSDWVSGTSAEDEKFIGYVESIDAYGTVKVRVTQCDHEEAIGQVVTSSLGKLSKLTDYVPVEAGLRSLMDLALMTRDQEWFDDLYANLRMLQFDPNRNDKPFHGYGSGPSISRVRID